jgi:hypothetical protein
LFAEPDCVCRAQANWFNLISLPRGDRHGFRPGQQRDISLGVQATTILISAIMVLMGGWFQLT